MVVNCCVKTCKNECYPGSRYSFHSFPKNEVQKAKWLSVVPAKKANISKTSTVCSAHFKSDDFITSCYSARKLLKPGAVPSIFAKDPDSAEVSNVEPPLEQSNVDPPRAVGFPNITILPLEKNDGLTICIEPGPAPKRMKVEESKTNKVSTMNTASTQTTNVGFVPRALNNKLRHDIKVLRQRLRRRDATIANLKSVLNTIQKNIHTSLKTTNYSDEMKSFAISLYSNDAFTESSPCISEGEEPEGTDDD